MTHRMPEPGAAITSAPRQDIGRREDPRGSRDDPRWQARQNRLLAALPVADFNRLRRTLEPVALPLGRILCEAGAPAGYAYFPVTGIVSLMQELASGATLEVALAGNDGMIGIAIVTGSASTTTRAIVRAAGIGYRLRADVLKTEFEQCLPLRRIVLRYTQSRILQVAQSAMCGRYHTVEQQVCRILLSTIDRLASDDLALTQELIADLVGVRRESVTTVAVALQAAGIIRYHRGRIAVLDRPALARRACGCNAVLEREALRRFRPSARRAASASHSGALVRTAVG